MASQRKQLVGIVGGFIISKIPDYYYISVDPLSDPDDESVITQFVKREPNDYYKLILSQNQMRFMADSKSLPGVQARLFFAAFNSVIAGDFGRYPADSEFCINRMFGYSAHLDSLLAIAPHLDRTNEKSLRITAGRRNSGFSRFIGSLSEKGAELSIDGSLPQKDIEGLLKPFFHSENAEFPGVLASYIAGDYAMRHP